MIGSVSRWMRGDGVILWVGNTASPLNGTGATSIQAAAAAAGSVVTSEVVVGNTNDVRHGSQAKEGREGAGERPAM